MIYLGLHISFDVYDFTTNKVNKYAFEICIQNTINFIMLFIMQLLFNENMKLLLQEYKIKYLGKLYLIINTCSNIGISIFTMTIVINSIFFILTYLIKNVDLKKEIMGMNLVGIVVNMVLMIVDLFVVIDLVKSKSKELRKTEHNRSI
jgi:hypothetical protein